MYKDQPHLAPSPRRLATCWRAVLQSYGHVNVLTHHVLGFLVRLAILGYFLFCILFLVLRHAVLPNVDRYKADIEQIASTAIGAPLSIARIGASWNGLMPILALQDVRVRDRSGREALMLPQVTATLSWWSAVVGDLRLHSLEVLQPDLDIRRDADGRLFAGGILIDLGKSGDGKSAEWLLAQREIIIRQGRLRWNDGLRKAPELSLNNVNVVLRNKWQAHQFALNATPPAALAAPLDVRATFHHPRFARKMADPALWRGEVYADLRETDLAAWKSYLDYPVDIAKGRGAVRSWLKFDHAKVADLTADLTLTDVSARLGKDLEILQLDDVRGRIALREEIDVSAAPTVATFGALGHAVSLTDFSMRTADGLTLPTTTISESYLPARKGQPEKTTINARILDLETLANFVERLPLPATQRKMLQDFSPRGKVSDFSASWQGAYPDVSAYALKGRFSGLALSAQPARAARPHKDAMLAQAALPAIPGFDNLSGSVDANDRGGAFNVSSDRLKLHLAGYLADPTMQFQRLDMQASWRFEANDQLLFKVSKMDFAQDGIAGSFKGSHLMPLGAPHGKPLGTIDVEGQLSMLELQKIDNFLPLSTPEKLRGWLRGALNAGVARDLKIKLKGNLADFPFNPAMAGDKPKGEFSVSGTIEKGRLNYAPAFTAKDGIAPLWPVISDINGTIAFNRTRMEIFARSATTHGVALVNVKAVIPDLLPIDKTLEIDGSAKGPLQELVGFTNDSPVAGWIGNFTEETKGSGMASLALKLQLPLNHMIDAKVQGVLALDNNDVILQTLIPPLLATSGKLEFNEKGLNLNGMRSTFLGGPVGIAGGTQRDGAIVIRADGTLSGEGLRKTYANTGIQKLSDRIAGSTRYTASIAVRKRRPEIVIESSMQGLSLDFPVPLRKAANESLPLKVELTGLASDDPTTLRDEIRLSLGSAISARYLRQKPLDKNAAWKVVNGGIGVNVPAPQPDSGLVANVSLKSLNIDAWRTLVASAASGDKTKASASSSDVLGIAQYIEPEVLAARASELIVIGKKLDNVVVGASHSKGVWQANIDADQASGYISWNEAATGSGPGRVTARLASLIIPKSAAAEVTDLLEGKNVSVQMPGLDIVAENFELFGKRFGRLDLKANNVRASAVREWRIDKLAIANDDATFNASGKWTAKEGDSLTNLVYKLDIANAGKLLERVGFAGVLRGGKGRMEGDLSWKGLPFSLDIPSLSGQMQVDIAAGQFLKVDPGAAKLLGVLSLQSLPRRLSLDFRDVFSEGFAFDGITGNASITEGVAKTENLKMRSVNATVLMDGTADIDKETQNLHVAVIPEINVGTASIVYALAVNPVIGIGSFLAQLFLREPLMRAFTFEYRISGGWKDPQVAKLDRLTGAPVALPASRSSNKTESVN